MKTNRSIIWLGILPALIVPAAMAGLAERPGDKSPQNCFGLRVAIVQPVQPFVWDPGMAGEINVIRGQA
ncbi:MULTISPECIES: hypothetical protein [unclassified Microbulbifer]|nr:hypothetical protein [Microbulbifer sp. YPW16]UHQ53654.1 hypothetical protein LVE68_09010 [Microbulbifer sp. YPW16]